MGTAKGFRPLGKHVSARSYKVAIGHDVSVQEIEARTDYRTAQTRDVIARVLLACVGMTIAYAAVEELRKVIARIFRPSGSLRVPLSAQ